MVLDLPKEIITLLGAHFESPISHYVVRDEICVAVSTKSPLFLRSLFSLVTPYFSISTGVKQYSVHLIYSQVPEDIITTLYEMCVDFPAVNVEAENILDIPKLYIKRFRISNSVDMYYLLPPLLPTCVFFSRNMQTVHIISELDDPTSSTIANKIIQELGFRTLDLQQHVPLHAACAEIDGKGILLTGGKGVGKTTTLSAILMYANCKLVTNDRMTVDRNLVAHAWPLSVGVRLGTCFQNPILKRFMHTSSGPTFAVNDHKAWNAFFTLSHEKLLRSNYKIRFSNEEFANIFSCAISPTTGVRMIVVPAYMSNARSTVIRQVTTDSAVHLLWSELLTRPNIGMEKYSHPSEFYWRENLEKIAAQVPVYYMYQNQYTLQDSVRKLELLVSDL